MIQFRLHEMTGGGAKHKSRGKTTYKFDGNLLVVQQVGAFKDDTERTFTNLFANPVVDTHHVRRR